jgi:DNA polymerase-3 subunit chi
MTRIDFYILPHRDENSCWQVACRLAEKAYRMGHQVYLHTETEAQQLALEQSLWSFRSDAYLPHGEADDPIVIGRGDDPGHHHDVLINLGQQVPGFHGRFQRMAELVYQEPAVLQASRERWKYYQHRGYPLQSHRL